MDVEGSCAYIWGQSLLHLPFGGAILYFCIVDGIPCGVKSK